MSSTPPDAMQRIPARIVSPGAAISCAPASRSPATCWAGPRRHRRHGPLSTRRTRRCHSLSRLIGRARCRAGRPGGDKRGKQSAALIIYASEEYPELSPARRRSRRAAGRAAPACTTRRSVISFRSRKFLPTRASPAGTYDRAIIKRRASPPAGGGQELGPRRCRDRAQQRQWKRGPAGSGETVAPLLSSCAGCAPISPSMTASSAAVDGVQLHSARRAARSASSANPAAAKSVTAAQHHGPGAAAARPHRRRRGYCSRASILLNLPRPPLCASCAANQIVDDLPGADGPRSILRSPSATRSSRVSCATAA